MTRDTGVLMIALGGNAITRAGDEHTIDAQYRRAEEALGAVADLAATGRRVALTHGNGPVVGNIVRRGELAAREIPPTPLFIADADSEGGIGLVLQQVLGNLLATRGVSVPVVTAVTQTVVAPDDPAFDSPTKPIGPYYDHETAMRLAAARGWTVAEEAPRGWRRTVASPRPLEIVEVPAVRALLDAGCIPIAAGGGGVPVVRRADGTLRGIDCVVDKDWAGAVLASQLGASTLAILMEADALYRDWGTSAQTRISTLRCDEAEELVRRGDLARGSIRPKVEAATWFARNTGGTAIIAGSDGLVDALSGRAGTRIIPG